MNKQQAFNRIWKHFSQPYAVLGENENKKCVYRGMKDPRSKIRCSVGVLIPNKYYDSDWENSTVDSILERVKPESWFYENLRPISSFLGLVQSAHDGSHSVKEFLTRLRGIAEEEGLKVPK